MVLYYIGICSVYLIAILKYTKGKSPTKMPKILGTFKKDAKMGLFFVQIILIRDVLTPISLIFGAGNPYYQIIPLIFFSLVCLVFLLITRPFSSKIENII